MIGGGQHQGGVSARDPGHRPPGAALALLVCTVAFTAPRAGLTQVRTAAALDTVRTAALLDTVRTAALRDTVRTGALRDTVRTAALRDTVHTAAARDTVRTATALDSTRTDLASPDRLQTLDQAGKQPPAPLAPDATHASFVPPPPIAGSLIPSALPALQAPPVLPTPLAGQRLSREEAERAGARTPFQLLDLLPDHRAVEASGTVEIGALATRGSFGGTKLEIDGWSVRLPRLEGRDLAAMLLDRLGPHPGYASYASLGSLTVAVAPERVILGQPELELTTIEPLAPEGSRSRATLYKSGFALTGGGLTLSDRRGAFDYRLGVVNAKAGRSGGVEDMTTRLALIDAGGWHGPLRLEMSMRNGERDLIWKTGQWWSQDDQGVRLAATLSDSGRTVWRLHSTLLDDRLSGSEFPALEFRRKGWVLGGGATTPGAEPSWLQFQLERDWLAIRSPVGTLAPRVERGTLELGSVRALAAGTLAAAAAWRISDRHPPRVGGGLDWRWWGGEQMLLELSCSRVHVPPTLDQEVLARGRPVAEPERTDQAGLRLEHAGSWTWSGAVHRRHLGHVPEIIRATGGTPWPEYDFAGAESAHWEFAAGFLTPPAGRYAFRLGGSIRQLEIDDDPRAAPAYVPHVSGRATLTARLALLDSDLVLRPRLDLLFVGERYDFADRERRSHLRVDATLIAIMLGAADLELSLRNLTDRRYPLPVIDTVTGESFRESGRMTSIGIRWNLDD